MMHYETILLARLGEITLKGQNRRRFEQRLIKNMRYRIEKLGDFKIQQSQSRIWIEPLDARATDAIETAQEIIRKVFGVVGVSIVRRFPSDWEYLKKAAADYVSDLLQQRAYRSFKVETRRGNKQFPLNSQEISREIVAQFSSAIISFEWMSKRQILFYTSKSAKRCISMSIE